MDKVCIFSDNQRHIQFNSIITIYEFDLFSVEDIPECDLSRYSLTIIDALELETSISVANDVRSKQPSMPLLLINDFTSPSQHFHFTKIAGYGLIKSFQWRKEHPNDILIKMNSMLHPEYPSKTSDIAIVIPVYNEESRFNNVLDFIEQLKRLLNSNFINMSIYFVNDGSHDNTKKLIDELADKENNDSDIISNNSVFTIRELEVNTRKAGTYIEGLKTIKADYIIFVDADNSFIIEDIAKLINIIQDGYYDIIIGTKDQTAENRPLVRRAMSFTKRLLTKPLLPKGIYDSQTGLKALNATAAKYILPYLHENTGLAIDLEMVYIAKKLRFRALQLPVTCIDREGSHVNIVKDSLSFITNIIKLLTVNKNIKIDKSK